MRDHLGVSHTASRAWGGYRRCGWHVHTIASSLAVLLPRRALHVAARPALLWHHLVVAAPGPSRAPTAAAWPSAGMAGAPAAALGGAACCQAAPALAALADHPAVRQQNAVDRLPAPPVLRQRPLQDRQSPLVSKQERVKAPHFGGRCPDPDQPHQLAASGLAQWRWQPYVAFGMIMASTMEVQNACRLQFGKLGRTIWV